MTEPHFEECAVAYAVFLARPRVLGARPGPFLLRRTVIKSNTTTSRTDRLWDAATEALRVISVPMGAIAFGFALNVLFTGTANGVPGRLLAGIYVGMFVLAYAAAAVTYYVLPVPNAAEAARSLARDALVLAGVALDAMEQTHGSSRDLLVEYYRSLGLEPPAHLTRDTGKETVAEPKE